MPSGWTSCACLTQPSPPTSLLCGFSHSLHYSWRERSIRVVLLSQSTYMDIFLLAKDCVHCFIVMLLSFIILMWTSGHHLAPCDINDIRVKCHEGMCLEGCCKRSSTDVDSLIVIDHLKYVTQHFSFAFKLYESSLLCYGCQKDLRKGHTCASGRLRQPPLSDVVRSVSRFQVDGGAKRHITFIF